LLSGSQSSARYARQTSCCTNHFRAPTGSLFRTNRIGLAGSGKYVYFTKAKCPWEVPRVRLISYVKCCETVARVTASINDAMKTHDVVIVTGDEYCRITDTRPHFRQYFGTSVISRSERVSVIPNWQGMREMMDGNGTIFPLYIPLGKVFCSRPSPTNPLSPGPREEFELVDQATVVASTQRKYLYNFLGSMTSYSRRVLKRILLEELSKPAAQVKYPGFVHITDRWHIKVNTQNGYVTPERYRQILLESVFTLCPTGHNPEAYRIFEALEAGSIPILSLDRWYNRHDCAEAFKPFRDAGAPFIYLNGGWGALEAFLERRGTNTTWVAERQVAVREWYTWWMHQTAMRFEAVLDMRFRNRMKTKRDDKAELEDEKIARDGSEDQQLQEVEGL
jgi:hypothetical protein